MQVHVLFGQILLSEQGLQLLQKWLEFRLPALIRRDPQLHLHTLPVEQRRQHLQPRIRQLLPRRLPHLHPIHIRLRQQSRPVSRPRHAPETRVRDQPRSRLHAPRRAPHLSRRLRALQRA